MGLNFTYQFELINQFFGYRLLVKVCIFPHLEFRLRIFDSGVMVIELQSHNEEEMVASALETVCKRFIFSSHL